MATGLSERKNLSDLDKAIHNARTADYPKQSIYLFASLIFVVSLYNIVSISYGYYIIHRARLLDSTVRKVVEDREKQETKRTGSLSARSSVRRLPSALLNLARTAAYRFSVPTWFGIRLTPIEIFIPLVYVLAILVWEFVNARNIINGQLDPTYWANRAGTLAVCKLTFIAALSGKNNIISLLTGISYEKLSILHRVSARTLLLLIWIHFWGKWKQGLGGTLANGWARSGVLAAVSLTLAIIITNRKTRNHAYELFVVSHNVLIFMFLLAVYFHVRHFPEFVAYAWPPFVVWGFDRLLRLSRVVHIRHLSSKMSSSPANALVEIISAGVVRVTLRVPSSKLLFWRPGQHAFLIIPSVSRSPLEAHPFTIASLDSPDHGEVDLKFIICARTGFTRRLYDYASRVSSEKSPTPDGISRCQVSAYMDGPYGSPPRVNTYPNVILVAGGSGISYTLPILLDIIRGMTGYRSADAFSSFGLSVNKVIADFSAGILPTSVSLTAPAVLLDLKEHLRWISDDLDRLAKLSSAGLDIDIRIFVTGSTPNHIPHTYKGSHTAEADVTPSEEANSEKRESAEGSIASGTAAYPDHDTNQNNPFITVTRARRESVRLGQLLEDEISLCSGRGPVAVHVSGPTTLTNGVRRSLRKPRVSGPTTILKGGASIFLHVETFGIA